MAIFFQEEFSTIIPGTLAMTQDSPFVHTSCDLRDLVGPNTNFPRISIAGRQYDVVPPADARTITLGDTYCGSDYVYEGVERIFVIKKKIDSSSSSSSKRRSKKKVEMDYRQDWIRLEGCMVRVAHGSDVAWTNCDLSNKDSEIDGTIIFFFFF